MTYKSLLCGLIFLFVGACAAENAALVQQSRDMCESGVPMGCNNLGTLYEHGNGVAQDASKAAELYEKACDFGVGLGCSNLGGLFLTGNGVEKNMATAVALFEQACEEPVALGCYNLGGAYLEGLGTREGQQIISDFL